MSYLLEDFVGRITSPVVCLLDGKMYRYENGEALRKTPFDKPYMVVGIKEMDGSILLELQENGRINDVTWADNQPVTFF